MSPTISKYLSEIDKVIPDPNSLYKINSVCYEPTNRCPGGCPYCLIEHHQKDINYQYALETLDMLMEYGVMRFGFGGGEPMLLPFIYELGEYLYKRGRGSLLRTSGMFPIDIEKCKKSFHWIDISLDSIDSDVFKICRPNVSYDQLIKNILELSSQSYNLRMSILLTKLNANTAKDTIDWLAKNGIRHVRLQKLVLRGRAVKNQTKVYLGQQDEALDELINYAVSLGINATELKSVGTETLCIIKPNRDIYIGNPTGSFKIGNLQNSTDFEKVSNHLVKSQAIYT